MKAAQMKAMKNYHFKQTTIILIKMIAVVMKVLQALLMKITDLTKMIMKDGKSPLLEEPEVDKQPNHQED